MSNEENQTNTAEGQSELTAVVSSLRLLEVDHDPDGWPAVRMKEITTVCDELHSLMQLLVEVEQHVDEWNFPLTLKDRVTEKLNSYYGEVRPQLWI